MVVKGGGGSGCFAAYLALEDRLHACNPPVHLQTLETNGGGFGAGSLVERALCILQNILGKWLLI